MPLPLERHTLANGLRVVLHRDPRLPLVAIDLWYHVGSKHDRPGRTGLAHLFEHLLFEGSAHVRPGDHFRLVQEAGGVANGSTWFDRTNYYETLPSHQLDLGLWLESDRMGFTLPAIDRHKLDTQRQVVINERRQRIDNQPYGRANERLFELLYPEDHPYHWPVIGYVEDLEHITIDDVRTFFRTYYAPDNAVLTLAGDVDPEHALARVEHWFGELPPGGGVPRPAVPPVPAAGERREVMVDRVRLPRVYMAFDAPPYGTDDWYAGDLWVAAMSEGKASVLHQDLVYRRQLAQEVACYLFPTEETAMLLVLATARPDVEPQRLEDAVSEHLRRSAEEPLAEAQLERALSRLLAAHYSELQTLGRRADRLSWLTTFFDDPAALATVPERYARLTAEDVRAFVAAHCRPHRRVVLTVMPAAERSGSTP